MGDGRHGGGADGAVDVFRAALAAGGGVVAGTGTGAPQDLTVYGEVLAQQTPPVGQYTDTVVATVQF